METLPVALLSKIFCKLKSRDEGLRIRLVTRAFAMVPQKIRMGYVYFGYIESSIYKNTTNIFSGTNHLKIMSASTQQLVIPRSVTAVTADYGLHLKLPDSVTHVDLTCSVAAIYALPDSIVSASIDINSVPTESQPVKILPFLTHLTVYSYSKTHYYQFLCLDTITHLTINAVYSLAAGGITNARYCPITVFPKFLKHLTVNDGLYEFHTKLPDTLTHLELPYLYSALSKNLPVSLKYLTTATPAFGQELDLKHLTSLVKLTLHSRSTAKVVFPENLKYLFIDGDLKINDDQLFPSLVLLRFSRSRGFPINESFKSLKKLIIDYYYDFPSVPSSVIVENEE